MEKFTTVESIALPLPIRNVDTDMIIPASFLTSTSKAGYGKNVFKVLREQDPQFPFNLPRYQKSEILIADENFGCGSSREHAVWALKDFGIKVIIAKGFADIFAGNAAKNGLLLITLPAEQVDAWLKIAREEDLKVIVDLEQEVVRVAGGSYQFKVDAFRKYCFLNGVDDLDYLLQNREAINNYFVKRQQNFFFDSTKPNN